MGLALNLGAFGHPRQAIALLQQVVATDPHNGDAHYYLGWNLAAIDALEQAEQAQQKSLELQPGAMNVHEGLATILVMRGDAKAALAVARQEPDPASRDFAVAMALQAAGNHAASDAALKTLIGRDSDVVAYQIAEFYAFRRDSDNVCKWLDRAWANRDPGIGLLLTDPYILRSGCPKTGSPHCRSSRVRRLSTAIRPSAIRGASCVERFVDPALPARFMVRRFCKTVGLPTTTDAMALP
ncbi:MAG: tetratricopeptide repeat protein [Rhodanobacteraceae bacterium]